MSYILYQNAERKLDALRDALTQHSIGKMTRNEAWKHVRNFSSVYHRPVHGFWDRQVRMGLCSAQTLLCQMLFGDEDGFEKLGSMDCECEY